MHISTEVRTYPQRSNRPALKCEFNTSTTVQDYSKCRETAINDSSSAHHHTVPDVCEAASAVGREETTGLKEGVHDGE